MNKVRIFHDTTHLWLADDGMMNMVENSHVTHLGLMGDVMMNNVGTTCGGAERRPAVKVY